MPYSPQERERRRQVALRLHREGKLGTRAHQESGRRARSRKASDLAQKLVRDNEQLIEKTLKEILKTGTRSQQLKAVESLLKLGLQAERLDVAEDRMDAEGRSREELIAMMAARLSTGPGAVILAREMAERHGIVEATAADVIRLPRRSS
jgi:hypothetical protein